MLKWLSFAVVFASLLIATHASAQTASVKATSSAAVGSKLTVQWTGPAEKGDFISIDAAGAGDAGLIKVIETDGEVVLINANHIREVQVYGPPERQPPRGS